MDAKRIANEGELNRSQAQSGEISSLIQLIDTLSLQGEKWALLALTKEGELTWSYATLAHQIESLAHGLKQIGLGPGKTAALLAEGRPEAILVSMAVIRVGAVIAPLDVQFSSQVLETVLPDSGASFLFTTTERFKRIAQLKLEQEIRPILLDVDAQDSRSWRALFATAGGELPTVSPSETAALFYTSGTTGAPKGVPLSHQNIAFQLNTLGAAGLVSETERVLLPLPLHHIYPFVVGMLAPLALGLTLVLPQSLTGPQIVRALRQGQVTFVVGVPRLYSALYSGIESRFTAKGRVLGNIFQTIMHFLVWLQRRWGWSAGKSLLWPLHRKLAPQLRKIASGGAALNPELAWKLQSLGWQIAIGYGLTETSPLLTLNPPGTRKLDSVGKPVPGVEIRLDTSAAPHEDKPRGNRGNNNREQATPTGEILARGPGVFGGYHRLPEKTQEVFSDGWFRTGDLGRFDDEGYLYILGRVSTLIVTEGGENIQPEEVEEAYETHPVIREVGVLQREKGLIGVIVPELSTIREQGVSDIGQAVREAVSQVAKRLPSYQRLSDYAVSRDALPRTRLGKLRRHLLADYFDRAKEAAQAPDKQVKGPLPVEEMSDQDQALLEHPTAQQLWEWLAKRYAERRLTPDTSPALDLGVDSLEWLNLSLEIRERTGVELSEEAIGRIETIRDLLQTVTEASEATGPAMAPEEVLKHPEAVLDERQRRWLQPRGPVSSALARGLFEFNRLLMRLLFRLQVKGLEDASGESQWVFIANHASYLDPFLIAAALDYRRLRETYWGGWTGAAFRTPLQRLGSRLAGVIPVDPQQGVLSSLALGAAVLKEQKSLIWFPEGERSASGELQPFKPGVGLLLAHFSVPVVPVIIRGSYEALPPGKRWPRLRTITVSFGAPLNPKQLAREGTGDEKYQRISAALYERMGELLSRGAES
jgi:long-chain acyl-CoA synthetase